MAESIAKTAVVTGGAGFIGSHIAQKLVETNWNVRVVDDLSGSGASLANLMWAEKSTCFDFVQQDVREWATESNLLGVDVVFNNMASKNTVSMKDPLQDLDVNGRGTLQLLLASASAGVRKFVHASTGSVMGELRAVQDEEHPTRPASYYGVSKLAAESYCRVVHSMTALDVTALRYFHVVGPRQDDSDLGGVVPIFVQASLRGEPLRIFGSGEQIRSFTSVHDVVKANILVAHEPKASGRVLNTASGVKVSILQLAEFIRSECGSNSKITFGPWRSGDIVKFEVDNQAISDLGMNFDRDWHGIVRAVIDDLSPGKES